MQTGLHNPLQTFLRNHSRYFLGVCYSLTHDHYSPENPVPLGSWNYHGIQRTVCTHEDTQELDLRDGVSYEVWITS